MAVGVMLLAFWLILCVALSAMTFGTRDLSGLGRAGFGLCALASYPMVWWCCRFWYAAFSEGRREAPAAEPGAWPWTLPMLAVCVVLGFTSARDLVRGNSGAWFGVGLVVVMGGLSGMFLLMEVREWFSARRARRNPPVPSPLPPSARSVESPRPQRNWGSIGR
ncbi:hypothetical protein ACIGMX_41400 [Streptomyces aquilus]|uniref:hypothetical protein n=1 Tax=Streptomyces aquilus TaxID=2548456 RepID=UPI001045B3A7